MGQKCHLKQGSMGEVSISHLTISSSDRSSTHDNGEILDESLTDVGGFEICAIGPRHLFLAMDRTSSSPMIRSNPGSTLILFDQR